VVAKRYTEQHEWIEINDDKVGVVGISDYAQQLLGDVVYVELPPVDSFVSKGGPFFRFTVIQG